MIVEPGNLAGANILEVMEVIGAYTVVTFPFVIVAGGVFGLPTVAVLRRVGFNSLPTLLIAGAVAGSLFSGLLLWGAIALQKTTMVFIWASAIGVLPGLTAAFVWWFLAERRRAASAHD